MEIRWLEEGGCKIILSQQWEFLYWKDSIFILNQALNILRSFAHFVAHYNFVFKINFVVMLSARIENWIFSFSCSWWFLCTFSCGNFNLAATPYCQYDTHIYACWRSIQNSRQPGTISIQRWCLTNIGIFVIKIRQSHDHLIFIMGITIPGKTVSILKQGQ